MPIKVYAIPFFKKGEFDFLIETGWDDSVSYALLAAVADYEVALQFTSVDGVYFNDHDNDGRWEIQVLDVQSFKCANGAEGGGEMIKMHRAWLSADDICKLQR